MVAHTFQCNSSALEAEARRDHKLEVSLGYIMRPYAIRQDKPRKFTAVGTDTHIIYTVAF